MGWVGDPIAADAGVWVLKDSSDNELGLIAIWWGAKSGTPWTRSINEFRAFEIPIPDNTKVQLTTEYGTLSGGNVAAREASFQDIWDEFKSETGFEPGEDVVAYKWIGTLKEAPGFDV